MPITTGWRCTRSSAPRPRRRSSVSATRAAVTAYERAHRARKLWFFNRAGYSGRPGSAAYETGNFPGDESTDWGQGAGLSSLAPDMLSRAIGGAFGFAADIGGYYDYT